MARPQRRNADLGRSGHHADLRRGRGFGRLQQSDARRQRAQEGRAEIQGSLEAAPDAIVIVNQTGDIVLINSQTETLFGYARAELLGQKVEVLLPPRYRASASLASRQFLRRAEHAADGGRNSSSTASVRTARISDRNQSQPDWTTEDGMLVSSAIRDISERKRYESALRAKNVELQTAVNELDAFSYSVSHDLRTPLRAIDGFSRILLKQYGSILPDEPRKYLQLRAGQHGADGSVGGRPPRIRAIGATAAEQTSCVRGRNHRASPARRSTGSGGARCERQRRQNARPLGRSVPAQTSVRQSHRQRLQIHPQARAGRD